MFQIQFGNNKGLLIIDILIAISVIIIAFVSILGFASFLLRFSSLQEQMNQASFLCQEAIEAVRNFRDGTSWSTNGIGTLTTNLDYYPQATGSPARWQLVQGTENINGFERKVVFQKVSRDPITKNIELNYNPVNDDPDTIKVTATVSWQERGRTHKVEVITYLTNWKK